MQRFTAPKQQVEIACIRLMNKWGEIRFETSRLKRKSLKLAHRHGSTKQIPLISIAPLAGQKISLLYCLHTFSNHIQAHACRQRNHHSCDGRIVGVSQDVTNKAFVA